MNKGIAAAAAILLLLLEVVVAKSAARLLLLCLLPTKFDCYRTEHKVYSIFLVGGEQRKRMANYDSKRRRGRKRMRRRHLLARFEPRLLPHFYNTL